MNGGPRRGLCSKEEALGDMEIEQERPPELDPPPPPRTEAETVEKLAGVVPVPVAAMMEGSAWRRSHSMVWPSDLCPSSRVSWKTRAAHMIGIRIRRPRPSTLLCRSLEGGFLTARAPLAPCWCGCRWGSMIAPLAAAALLPTSEFDMALSRPNPPRPPLPPTSASVVKGPLLSPRSLSLSLSLSGDDPQLQDGHFAVASFELAGTELS
ncbi:hypothetical protein EUGRSUZ_G02583 [Eucalyptus grandis]|uniref:Uncharacterized protein n=2 Tax=Eucalyptus grandis TaxID=71139 RepID=A0ACC3K722_EUCGR|nr:hypothetical protein EUGRSUZ_G02583 [Eucalyptus grandis]